MSAPILITGAGGKVGRELCRALDLLDVGYVKATRYSVSERARRFDFRDQETWPGALKDVRSVFLLRPPALADIQTTIGPFIGAARNSGVQHIVFLSVAGAEKNRFLPHAAIERVLMEGPPDWTILRPDFFAQNLETVYLADIRRDDRLYLPAGSGRVAFVDLADVGEVAAKCLMYPEAHLKNAYHLTGPIAASFEQVSAALSEAAARTIIYQPASILGYVRHLRKEGLVWTQVLIQTYLHLRLRLGRSEAVSGDLRMLLGRDGNSVFQYIERRSQMWSTRHIQN